MSRKSGAFLFKFIEHREYVLMVAIVLLFLIMLFFAPNFTTLGNLEQILIVSAGLTVGAIGMTMIIITAGIDVSAGAILGTSASVFATMLSAGHPTFSILAALATGSALGAVNGFLIAFIGIPPIIVTLGSMSIFRAIDFSYLQGKWVSNFPNPFVFLGQGMFLGIPIQLISIVILLIIFTYIFRKTSFGRNIYAIGGNISASKYYGVSVKSTLFAIYVLAGVLYAFAAIVETSRTSIVQTSTGAGWELEIIAATILGGTNILGGSGSAIGSFLGAFFIASVESALVFLNTPPIYNDGILGVLLILAVITDYIKMKFKGAEENA